MAPAKRLFVAISLPEVVGAELVRLGTHIPGVRWHPPEKLHLTLAFLGEVVSPGVQKRLRETLTLVRASPFFLPLAGAGAFGGERPRALWIGTGRAGPHLFALHKAVHDAALAAGAHPGGRRLSRTSRSLTADATPRPSLSGVGCETTRDSTVG